VEIHFGVTFDEAIEEEGGEALGLRIGAKTGIEVGGIGFDDKDDGGGVGWGVGAGGEEENREEKRDGNTEDTENGVERRRNGQRGGA
jgi:hypothetical protein